MNMSSINNSAETVNAAAAAIISAENRVQQTTVQKRRWGSCWSVYWCFGSHKQHKRISHALVVPEATPPVATAPVSENVNHSTTVVFPFIAPPSSPASFLQSDPPSASYTPVGLLSHKSLSQNPYSEPVTSSIFTIGPYAYETQLVSPPVFSTYTTEPSTAAFTPPPEPQQMTTPSSPEVPFAQLLTSSLARARRRSSGSNQKFTLSQYEFQPYQAYPGSPGGSLISPGSTIPNSGTSSPFPDKQQAVLELRVVGDASKFVGYDYFLTSKWGSRLGSGSLTPNGLGSTLNSGSVTPYGLGSRLGSGTLTPNGGKLNLTENQVSEVTSALTSDSGPQKGETLIDHRVSFELTRVDVIANSLEKNLEFSYKTSTEFRQDPTTDEGMTNDNIITKNNESLCEHCIQNNIEEGQCCCKRQSVNRDFNFDNTKAELGSQSNWTFFPMIQSSVS